MQNQQNPYLVPLAIIIAGVIIAGAVLYSQSQPSQLSKVGSGSTGSASPSQPVAPAGGDIFGNGGSALAQKALPITQEDHIRGNPNAPLALIEFSDLQCPFCNHFHGTMQQVLREFGDKVKWVYRHFPLTSIHPEAMGAALASECVAQLGGNDAFWTFTDRVFESQAVMSANLYRQIASNLGLDMTDYDKCFSERRFQNKVQEHLDQAVAAGGRGTPYNIIVGEKGNVFPFSGALPFEQVKPLIEQALNNN